MLCRHLLCAHFHPTGGDRPCRCRCRCRYRVSPRRISLGSDATQLYPLSPGCGSSTPCYGLAEFDSDNSRVVITESPVSDVVSVVSFDMLSATSRCHSAPKGHRCLQRLWTGGLWSRRCPKLIWCLRICRAGVSRSTPRGHQCQQRLWTPGAT